MRTPRLLLGIFALALLLPLLLLLACSGSDELADGSSQEPTIAKEEGLSRIFEQEGVSWIFEQPLPLFDTSLISRFPTVNWERVTYLLYWSLRPGFPSLPCSPCFSSSRASASPAGLPPPTTPKCPMG